MSAPVFSASEINLSRSKLVQLALHLEVADKQLQYDFSRIAIVEMARTYERELLRSQKHLNELYKKRAKNKAKKRAKIRGWQIATQTYLKTLDHYLFIMDSGLPLEFLLSKQNKILILIGEQPVIITGPNSGADKQIEHNIVEQFCLQYNCQEYFADFHFSETGDTTAKPKTVEQNRNTFSEVTSSWTIHSDLQADLITSNGLIFKFSSIKDRLLKELWVNKIARELSLLIEQLKITQAKGNKIYWSSLKIHELPLTDNAQKIIINEKEDFIKLSLPLLGANQSLFSLLIPWIQSEFKNKTDYRMIIKKADRYFNRKKGINRSYEN